MNATTTPNAGELDTRRQNRAMLLTLIACMIAAHADRHVMSLLAAPVQEALDLNDVELGLLQGLAFSLFYAIAGLPLGWLLDRRAKRVGIAGLCVFVWSAATIASGFVGSFATLFFFRSVTAIAEAGLGPAAASLISQMGSRREVMRSSSLFMLAPWIGSGIALIGGGLALKLLVDTVEEPWRYVFVLLGLPGLALAPLLAWGVKEQPRAPRPQVDRDHGDAEARVPTFLPWHYAAMTANFLAVFGFVAWFPMRLMREHGLAVPSAGAAAGAAFLTAGLIGTLAANRGAGRRRDDSLLGLMRIFKFTALAGMVAAGTVAVSGIAPVAIACYAAFVLLASSINAMMLVPLQLSVRPWQQARAAAILGFCSSAVGGSLGPLFVGVLSNAGLPLSFALAANGVAGMLIAATCFFVAQSRLASVGETRVPSEAYPARG